MPKVYILDWGRTVTMPAVRCKDEEAEVSLVSVAETQLAEGMTAWRAILLGAVLFLCQFWVWKWVVV